MQLRPLSYGKFLAIRQYRPYVLPDWLQRRLVLYYQGSAGYPWSFYDLIDINIE